ncbi:hypothetical protein [Microbacterium sp. RU33B]|uniref:hypothetical protein n=1 Tax=Microbacterium sp. RU33B TaxID=1907390 RepID=UPI0009606F3B|nr:hypothetical protein [Microbacterium sp. RU33B]SIT72448.1 hypothetical protein SAMN05880545_1055 [Microbacterium sp. RU33B]
MAELSVRDRYLLQRRALTDEERDEYDALEDTVGTAWLPVEKRAVAIGSSLAGAMFAVSAGFFIATWGRVEGAAGGWLIALTVASGVALFGGLIAALVLGRRVRNPARARLAELRDIGKGRLSGRPAIRRDTSSFERSRFPVTKVYDPSRYYAAGGRATARGVAETGIGDVDTYRNNVIERE